MGQFKPTSAVDKRRKSTYLFRASDELIIRLRKVKMTTLVLNNLIPFPLLKAAQEYQSIQEGKTQPQRAEMAQDLMESKPEMLDGWNAFLRHYASVVAVEPQISLTKPENPEILWADEVDGDELLAILNASPEQAIDEETGQLVNPEAAAAVADKEAGPLVVTEEAAAEFRGAAQPFARPLPPGSVPVSLETFRVDDDEREAIHG